ncbi:heme A synthase [Chitinimonas sp. BJYL2]|uniref:COX15/CtaA family protein n=1 Tax=Chitinimonas sp. BJYL2 TaxID=2976696 RepID=UPI0022B4785A|nr:COX15/CtaA family protein [Chitinimonas sp. BJYL2]
MFRKLVVLAVIWTFGLIVLGAFVRLSDAGLGCPDWPGCYGKVTPLHAAEEITAAHASDPHGPVSMRKAWKEMVHRYFATGLGLLILIIAAVAVKQRRQLGQSPLLAVGNVFVVCFQGALGAWTVTMLLKPAIVTAHLIGGMLLLSLLVWLMMRQRSWSGVGEAAFRFRGLALLGLAIVGAQIILGGWVSTNYAAVVCTDFPTCQGALVPQMDFQHAFHVMRDLGETPEGNLLSMANLTAIHWLHRVGALITLLYVGWLAWRLYAQNVLRSLSLAVAAALFMQLALGISNVVFHLPLPVAVAHNAGAAFLLSLMVALNYRLAQR